MFVCSSEADGSYYMYNRRVEYYSATRYRSKSKSSRAKTKPRKSVVLRPTTKLQDWSTVPRLLAFAPPSLCSIHMCITSGSPRQISGRWEICESVRQVCSRGAPFSFRFHFSVHWSVGSKARYISNLELLCFLTTLGYSPPYHLLVAPFDKVTTDTLHYLSGNSSWYPSTLVQSINSQQ